MVHCRNALELHRKLGVELIEGEEDAYKLDQPWDNIICNYASFYMPWRAYFDKVMKSDANLYWMINDHDVEDNILLRNILQATNGERKYSVISNNTQQGFRQWILRKWIIKGEKRLEDCIQNWHTVNLNALTYEPIERTNNTELFEHKAMYWGSWRKWRLPYFKKYSHPSITFSTSPKNVKKLVSNGCVYNYVPPLKWGKESLLASANAALYIEDPHTHDNYAYPANRFYESLSYDLDILFDSSVVQTASRIGNCQFVNSAEEFIEASNNRSQDNTIWKKQAQTDKENTTQEIKWILDHDYSTKSTHTNMRHGEKCQDTERCLMIGS